MTVTPFFVGASNFYCSRVGQGDASPGQDTRTIVPLCLWCRRVRDERAFVIHAVSAWCAGGFRPARAAHCAAGRVSSEGQSGFDPRTNGTWLISFVVSPSAGSGQACRAMIEIDFF